MPRRPSDELDHRLRAPGARDGARERMMRENGGKVTVSEAFMRGGGACAAWCTRLSFPGGRGRGSSSRGRGIALAGSVRNGLERELFLTLSESGNESDIFSGITKGILFECSKGRNGDTRPIKAGNFLFSLVVLLFYVLSPSGPLPCALSMH